MNVYIYTLADPDTGEVRWVGKSNDPKVRLSGHLYHGKFGPPDRPAAEYVAWIGRLRAERKKPLIVVREEVPFEDGWDRESHWTAEMLRQGHRLLNTHNNGAAATATKPKYAQSLLRAEEYNALKAHADERAIGLSTLVREILVAWLAERAG